MARFYDQFMSFMLLALMVFSIFSFVIIFQEENNVTDKMINDPLLNESFQDMQTELQQFQINATAQKDLFDKESVKFRGVFFFLSSMVSSGKSFGSMIIIVYNLIIDIPVKVLGLSPVAVAILGTMLILTVIVGLWIIYKIGG